MTESPADYGLPQSTSEREPHGLSGEVRPEPDRIGHRENQEFSWNQEDKCFESDGGVRTIAFHTHVILLHAQTMS